MLKTGWRDLSPGATIVVLGAVIAWIAIGYPLGSLFRPGPGFFPLAIGLILVVLGFGVMIESQLVGAPPVAEEAEDPDSPSAWRPMIFTSAGMIAFAVLLERAGYVPAALVLVFVTAFGERQPNWRAMAAIAAFMAVFGTAVFIYGLGLPIRTFGAS